MDDVNAIDTALQQQREEYRTTGDIYNEILKTYETVWKADKDIRKEHRLQLEKLSLIQKEHRQLIQNEEKLAKEYQKRLPHKDEYDYADPLQRELDQILHEQKDLEFEINKNIGDMRTQEVAIDNLRLTNNSYSKSMVNLETHKNSKINKTYDNAYLNESMFYEYKEKVHHDSLRKPNKQNQETG